MKPNIPFLTKVRAGSVRKVFRYSPKTGGKIIFVGGEATARKHADAGYINMPGFADFGRPAVATLTASGIAALAEAGR